MKDLSYFAKCMGFICLSLLNVGLNATESCDPSDDCAEGELLDGRMTSSAFTNAEADFFVSAGIRCDRLTSTLGGYEGSGEVMPYVNASWDNFDQKASMQKKLLRLKNKYPTHPVLNWQAGWLSFMKRDFEKTITLWTTAANQGEPNAAYQLAWIGLGIQDADLELLAKCIEVAAKADPIIYVDGDFYLQWFKEEAMATLAGLYIHDVTKVPSFESRLLPIIDWHPVPYNPELASELIHPLSYKNTYVNLEIEIKSRVSEFLAEKRRRKEAEEKLARAEEEEAYRRYTETLQLTASQLSALEDRCSTYSTIKGVCWALNFHEMRSVLTSRGYVTKSPNRNSFFLGAYHALYIYNELVEFNCGVFNACDLSMRELASRLQKSGIVIGSMEANIENLDSYIPNTSSTKKSFCGRGLQGEKICVAQTASRLGPYSSPGDIKVILSKGLVGKEVSFD
ncbi:MAG: hypothetical protein P8N61_01490 [Porticoccaceae bacterium]|nr:hypothetical protein [Porticoccaceae bacterium]